jgi:hypothetical protein
MSDIHFCDLCNESVPDLDLRERRALLVKGRVVCATCNRAMSIVEPGSAPHAGPSAAPGASPRPPHETHAWRDPRPSGSVFAVAIAMLALTGAAALGYWTTQEFRERDDRAEDRLGSLERRHDRLTSDVALERQGLVDEIAALEQRLAAADAEHRRALDERLAEQSKAAATIGAAVSELAPRLERLDGALERIERQDQDLGALQRRLAELALELNRLSGDVERQIAEARNAPAPVAAAPEELRPAWHGLLAELASESVSARWQAITALGETRDPAIAPHVLPSLKDADIFIRVAAARVLGDVGNPAAVEPLIEALADDVGTVRDAAYLALKSITKRDLPFDPESEDEGERGRRIKAWREWWAKERSKFGA